MFKVISIESERILESEVSMIPAPVIEFFDRHYGIDVSGVKVVYEDMKESAGYYLRFEPNTIHISNAVKNRGLVTESVMVHELNHLAQYEYDKSLTITKQYIFDNFYKATYIPELVRVTDVDEFQFEQDYGVDYEDIDFVKAEYWDLHIEIDSRLTEALYLYTEAGKEGLDTIIDHVFNCGLTNNLFDRINNMPNSMAKVMLLNEFNRRKEIEDNKKHEHITNEELDLLVEELFA